MHYLLLCKPALQDRCLTKLTEPQRLLYDSTASFIEILISSFQSLLVSSIATGKALDLTVVRSFYCLLIYAYILLGKCVRIVYYLQNNY